MTEATQAGRASGTGGTDSSTAGAKERAQEVAGAAAEQGQAVAGTAAQEARDVAGEAAQHARDLLGEARDHLETQSRDQLGRLVDLLRGAGEELDQMAQQGDGVAADLARQVADRAHRISRHVDGREPADLLDEVRGLARRRPGTFLLGALAAGVAAGRLARGAKDGAPGSRATGPAGAGSSPHLPQTTGDADPGPIAGRPMPTGVPQAPTLAPPVPTRRADDPIDPGAAAGTGLGGDPAGYGARPAGGGPQ